MIPSADSPISFHRADSFRTRPASCPRVAMQTNATATDINRDKRDRVVFVRPALFAPAFVSFRHKTNAAYSVLLASAIAVHIHGETTPCAFCRRDLARYPNADNGCENGALRAVAASQ